MSPIRTAIQGTGSFVPPLRLTTAELAVRMELPEPWIVQRTGIRSRYLADRETSSADLGLQAARRALARAELDPKDLDLIIVATSTPDYPVFPSTGCLMQHGLGAVRAAAFDLSAACTGFTFGLHTADQFIRNGTYRHVLLVCTDTLTKYVDWNDRATNILFGDGAAALVLGAGTGERGVLGSYIRCDGSGAPAMLIKRGGARQPPVMGEPTTKENFIYMNGMTVFRFAARAAADAFHGALEQLGMTAEQIDLLVLHQANQRIIDQVVGALGFPADKVLGNIESYGNTSVASIPLVLDQAVDSGRLSAGKVVLAIGFGAGFTWGANVIRW
jgi:3-oxoacyl-[acyl-carrier-protein] synthase-3